MSLKKPAPQAKDIKKASDNTQAKAKKDQKPKEIAKEIGGPEGPEPTRYGDWEIGGKCVDF